MPALVLATGESMHVENGVNAFCGTSFNHSVNQSEAALFDLEVLSIVHEVTVVDRHPNTVQSQGRQEFGIFPGEEVVEEAVKEVIVLFVA